MLGGIDIGTTGCKITIYENDGTYCYRIYQDYPVSRKAKEHEISAEAIWTGVRKILKEAARNYPDIQAIGITSFGESCVLLDGEDRPVRPVMLYTDPRGMEEAETLKKRLGAKQIWRITGVIPHSMYSLPKVMWVKKHCPQDYGKTRRILMMEDYVIYMLTGNAVIDHSLAARSMAFDIRSLQWSEELFEAAGIDKNLFSTPVTSGSPAGYVKKELAAELGLRDNVVIVPVGHDQAAAAVGSGVFETGSGVDGAGTVECITPVFEGIPEETCIREGGYAIVPYVIPGKYVTYAFSYTGGALISWYISRMAKDEMRRAEEAGTDVYRMMEENMKDEPTGILVLPHFAGAATPYMDVDSRGAILGLTIEHTNADVYRAMMEGVVYEMKLNMEQLKKAGIAPERLQAAGGGAASETWMQMKADILGIPVTSLGNTEAGAAGCAMMAGIAIGLFDGFKTAGQALIREKKTYYPRQEMHQKYNGIYERYRKLYETIRPLMI